MKRKKRKKEKRRKKEKKEEKEEKEEKEKGKRKRKKKKEKTLFYSCPTKMEPFRANRRKCKSSAELQSEDFGN